MNKKLICLSSISLPVLFPMTLFLNSAAVSAADWTERTTLSGFYSARYSQTNEKEPFHGSDETGINKDGSFQGTKLGLTVSSQVTDNLNVAMLLMSAADHEEFATHVDWAFASFSLNDNFTLRTGKLKFPVGLVNEYVDVGATYPWINAPILLYSEEAAGPQATREAYTGASLLWEGSAGDNWMLGSDLFFGQVDLNGMTVKGVTGVTARAVWDDTIEFQASTYQGEMHTKTAPMMDEETHSATLVGIKADWNNVIAYAEAARVKMDVTDMMGNNPGNSNTWYATLGYRIGKFLPHITRQDWERDNGNNQQISTLGLSYSFSGSTVIKLEQSRIGMNGLSDNPSEHNFGLFHKAPSSDSVNMTSIAVDVIF